MKINITNKQYYTLVKAIEVSNFIYGPIGDFVDDKYKLFSKELDKLLEYLLIYRKDFNFNPEYLEQEIFEGKKVEVTSEKFTDKVLEDIREYDDYITFDNLANELGKRDFYKHYSKEDIKKMSEKSRGYIGVELFPFEKKWHDEFEKYGFERLEVKE